MTEEPVRAPRGASSDAGPRSGGGGGPRSPGLPVRVWRQSVALGREMVAAAGGLVAALGVVLVVAVFVESLVDRSIDVQPLSVPKSLSDDGLSPEVVALALRDGMNALADRVRRERGYAEGTEIVDPEELPDVAVPSVGLSAQALAAEVRSFFKIQNRMVISGEIVSRNGAYELTLRLNGHSFFTSPKRLTRDGMDELFAQAARAAVRVTQPYVGAVVAFDEGDGAFALALCDGIIDRGGAAREVRFARLLRGQALLSAGRREEAAAAYEALLKLDPRDIAAHNDLGDVFAALGRRDAAVAEYQRAIAIDGALAFPHVSLAKTYLAMGRPEDALREARAGATLNPKFFYPHLVLARVLRSAGLAADAIREYRAAASLGPRRASVRVEIGEALRGFGLRDEAAGQFRAALALDPWAADARRDLASVQDEPGAGGGDSPGHDDPPGAPPAAGEPRRAEQGGG